MTALTRAPIGVIRAVPESWRMYRRLVEELAALAQASGVRPRPRRGRQHRARCQRARPRRVLLAPSRPHAGPSPGARGAARATRCGSGSASACPRRCSSPSTPRSGRTPTARLGEARLSRPVSSTPAREVWRCLHRYRVRYALGVVCLATATALSLAIPWTVKQAIDALHAGRAPPRWAGTVGLIVLCAAGNGVARLASRFAIAGGSQHVAARSPGPLCTPRCRPSRRRLSRDSPRAT